jgi:catalase
MRFSDKDGISRYGRYRIVPEAGNDYLDSAAVKAKSANFLFDELAERIAKGPIKFSIRVQLANDGDTVDDATAQWPEDRTVLNLGTLALTERVADSDHEQKHIIFDPIPRVDGIDPSNDPLLELRAAIYLLSGRRRRAA